MVDKNTNLGEMFLIRSYEDNTDLGNTSSSNTYVNATAPVLIDWEDGDLLLADFDVWWSETNGGAANGHPEIRIFNNTDGVAVGATEMRTKLFDASYESDSIGGQYTADDTGGGTSEQKTFLAQFRTQGEANFTADPQAVRFAFRHYRPVANMRAKKNSYGPNESSAAPLGAGGNPLKQRGNPYPGAQPYR